jgi:hypothetical protein
MTSLLRSAGWHRGSAPTPSTTETGTAANARGVWVKTSQESERWSRRASATRHAGFGGSPVEVSFDGYVMRLGVVA